MHQHASTLTPNQPLRCLAIDEFFLDINDRVRIRVSADQLPLTIGRSTDSDVRINCSKVSRQHGEFYLAEGGALCFRDYSANGTRVNEHLTQHNSACIIGAAEIKLSDAITLSVTPNGQAF